MLPVGTPRSLIAASQTVLFVLAEREPPARGPEVSCLIDDHFVRALEQEGFIDKLCR